MLLKLVAFSDRKAAKDLGGVLHCLEYYLAEDDRRYTAEHEGAGVPYQYTCAYLIGVDGRPFLDKSLGQTASTVLERFDTPDAEVIGIVARERGRFIVEREERIEMFELFRWYRLGIGL